MASLFSRHRRSRHVLRCALAAIVLLGCSVPAQAERAASLCRDLARRAERDEGIPAGLVQAVALAESGRWFRASRETSPWPWTVTSESDTFYLPSKEAALQKIRELQAAGRTNIDVGCMQVNLHYHGDAFASLEQAIDPARNVSYGARFLKRLQVRTRSWALATARYHSGDPARGEAYRTKVYRLWQKVQRDAGKPPPRLASGGWIVRGNAGQGSDSRLVTPGRSDTTSGGMAVLRGH